MPHARDHKDLAAAISGRRARAAIAQNTRKAAIAISETAPDS
jgi:hypothetical protein